MGIKEWKPMESKAPMYLGFVINVCAHWDRAERVKGKVKGPAEKTQITTKWECILECAQHATGYVPCTGEDC